MLDSSLSSLSLRALLVLIWALLVPVSAWAGDSTAGLVWLFAPFYIGFAILAIGVVASIILLIIKAVRVRRDKNVGMERAKIGKPLFWALVALAWVALFFLSFLFASTRPAPYSIDVNVAVFVASVISVIGGLGILIFALSFRLFRK